MAYELVEHVEVTNAMGVSAINFSNIPQTGVDLIIHLSGHSDGTLNSRIDLASFKPNFADPQTATILQGDTFTPSSFSVANNNGIVTNDNRGANNFGSIYYRILNYTSSNAKRAWMEATTVENSAVGYQRLITMNLGSSAVTSLQILAQTTAVGNLSQYTTASLYITY